MILSDGLIYGIRQAGNVLRVRYYTETIGSVWDDDRTVTQSGTDLYISGLYETLDNTKGSSDQILLEEGRIKFNDSKLFVNGSIQTTSGTRVFTVSLSGVDTVFREITPGVNMPQYFGADIYKKIYVRELPGGSLV